MRITLATRLLVGGSGIKFIYVLTGTLCQGLSTQGIDVTPKSERFMYISLVVSFVMARIFACLIH